MHIILTGATGTVGLPVLRLLLADPTVTRVTALSRKAFDAPEWEEDNLNLEKSEGEYLGMPAKQQQASQSRDATC